MTTLTTQSQPNNAGQWVSPFSWSWSPTKKQDGIPLGGQLLNEHVRWECDDTGLGVADAMRRVFRRGVLAAYEIIAREENPDDPLAPITAAQRIRAVAEVARTYQLCGVDDLVEWL